MYLQPIKNDDPQLDFYTIYEREAQNTIQDICRNSTRISIPP